MKKVLVYKKDCPQTGKVVGDIHAIGLPMSWSHWLKSDGYLEEMEVEGEVGEAGEFGKIEIVPAVPERWERDGYPDEVSEPTFSVDTWIRFEEADVLSEPVFAVDTWIKSGVADEIVDPEDISYTAYVTGDTDPRYNRKFAGETDSRYTHIIEIPSYKKYVEDAVKIAAEVSKVALVTRMSKGRVAREFCNNILDMIAGFNVERTLTPEQIAQMITDYAVAKAYLQDGQPFAAKIVLDAITPDEVITTTEMKDVIADMYAEFITNHGALFGL